MLNCRAVAPALRRFRGAAVSIPAVSRRSLLTLAIETSWYIVFVPWFLLFYEPFYALFGKTKC